MCRFVVYMGPPITLDLLTTRPAHSIIRQSFMSRMAEEPLNGDGFGIAWYVPEVSPQPAQFRSIQPAWNNVNLLHLARVSRSPVILAHVRAATSGFGVTESNCHPFVADQFAFMHNGSVGEFRKMKRRLCSELSDRSYQWIHGTTDSEHMFALFRDHAHRMDDDHPMEVMAEALTATIAQILRFAEDAGIKRRSLLNLAVSDGKRAVVSRFASDGSGGPSLYLRTGEAYVCQRGICHMIGNGNSRTTVIVASEPLTEEAGWREVPGNHLVLIDAGHQLETRAIPSFPGCLEVNQRETSSRAGKRTASPETKVIGLHQRTS
jgi:ergothioneine biosynthesis protein EgtC